MSLHKHPPRDAGEKRRRRRGCLIALAIFTMLFGLYAWMFFSDVGPGDDSDLRLPPSSNVPDEENAAYWWGVAMEGLEESSLFESMHQNWLGNLGLSPTGSVPIDQLESFVSENQHRFDAILRAAACERLVLSADLAPGTARVPLGSLVYVGSVHAASSSDRKRAIKLLRAHRSLRTRAGPLIWIGTRTVINEAWYGLIQSEDDPMILREWLRWFENPILGDDWADEWARASYEFWRAELLNDELIPAIAEAEGWIFADSLYRPLRTQARFAEVHRQIRDHARRGEPSPPIKEAGTWESFTWLLGGNMTGEKALRMLMFELSSEGPYKLARHAQAVDAMLRTSIALRIARLESGVYPSTLAELVPRLLDRVPRDPQRRMEGPLRWDPVRRLLWSVGMDGVDDDGVDFSGGKGTGWFLRPDSNDMTTKLSS